MKSEVLGKSLTVVFPDLDFQMENKVQNISLINKDNLKIDCAVIIKPLLDEKGITNGKVFIFHDISKEQELERMKIDFVSMAAHELRTPLTSIKGYLSVFMEENSALSDDHKTYLKRMNIASDQLIVLVENLLNITKIEKGALALNLESLDIVQTVKEIVDLLHERATQKNVTLAFPYITTIPKVKADKLRITEVITNLLANAIAYTDINGSVTILFEEKEGEVITHIKDTGQGIPKEALPHLFTKFYRVSGKLEQGSKGTGLGLYIAKAIIDMHNGKIWVESEVGIGSTFSFSLPIAYV